jgi:hypothetical protein
MMPVKGSAAGEIPLNSIKHQHTKTAAGAEQTPFRSDQAEDIA